MLTVGYAALAPFASNVSLHFPIYQSYFDPKPIECSAEYDSSCRAINDDTGLIEAYDDKNNKWVPYHYQKLEEITERRFKNVVCPHIYNPKTRQWHPLTDKGFRCAVQRGLTSRHLMQFMEHDIPLDEVFVRCAYFGREVKGQKLFDELWDLVKDKSPQKVQKENDEAEQFFFQGREDHPLRKLTPVEELPPDALLQHACLENDDPSKPNGLVIFGSNQDGTMAGSFGKKAKPGEHNPDTTFFHKIARVFNLCFRRVRTVKGFCAALKGRSAKQPLALLAIDAHGSPNRIFLDEDDISSETDLECLRESMAPNATVVMASCSTADGRERRRNPANHILNHLPGGGTVIAPQAPLFSPAREVRALQPHLDVGLRGREARIENDPFLALCLPLPRDFEFDITYRVDSSQPKKHCPKYGLSKTLAFCNKSPFLSANVRRSLLGKDLYDAMDFYQASTKTWVPVSRETVEFISEHSFSNRELQKISQSDWSLDQFAARAKIVLERADRINHEFSNEELTDGILNSTFWERRAADLRFDVLPYVYL